MQNLRLPALVFTALLFSHAASAQTSVYASAELTNYGYSSTANGTLNYSPGTGSYSYYADGAGISGGAFYLFPSESRLKAGVDLRGMYSPGSRGGAGSFGSLRVEFVPHENPLRPYFEIGGGFLTTVYASAASNPFGGRGRITSGAADIDFGLDVRTSSRLAIKAELGGFSGTNVGHASLGVGLSYTLHPRAAKS
jgi:hypothetical protein